MIKLEMTEDEFQLITDWAMQHFWKDTQSFDNDINVDECLRWSKACLLMARLKTEADKHGIHFGFHSPFYEDEPDEKKIDVTTTFMKQYCANVQRDFERITKLIDPTTAYEMAKTDYEERTKEEEKTNDGN